MRMRRHHRLIKLFAIITILLAGIPTVPVSASVATNPSPRVAPAPAADGSTPQFLNDLPDLQGLVSDNADFVLGGGFLYWAKCASNGGYLRRWPLSGGRAVTLQNTPFCTLDTAAADETGLYYWDRGNIIRRSAGDPFTALPVIASPRPTERIILNVGTNYLSEYEYLFWLANNNLYGANRYTGEPYGRPEPLGNNAHSVLFSSDGYFYWFADGILKQAYTPCFGIGSCFKTGLADENGSRLIDAEASLLDGSISYKQHPLWVSASSDSNPNGDTLRYYGCFPNVTVNACGTGSEYSAPARGGDRGAIGPLATDGTYLFWVENSVTCRLVDNPGCYPNNDGQVMKWKLNRSFDESDPFDTPQPIVTKTSGGSSPFTVNALSNVAIANGWVYFNTSNGLARVRTDAPPLSWNFAADSYEVTQGIQNLNNDVPLVAGKPTYVRFYGHKLDGPNAYGVDAILYGSRADGSALPGSPLFASNRQDFTANDVDPDRSDVRNGWLFQLPLGWTAAGNIKLSPVIDPRLVWNEPDRTNNRIPDRTFSFTHKAPICIVTIPVRTNAPAARDYDTSLLRMEDITSRLLPTARVQKYTQNTDVAYTNPTTGRQEPWTLPNQGDDLLKSLKQRDTLSDDPQPCHDAGAVTHYVGLVNAATNTSDKNGEELGRGYRPGAQLYVKLIPSATLATTTQFWQAQVFGTLAHELGHNYGRKHVDCGGPADLDPDFPYTGPSSSGISGPKCVIDDGKRTGKPIASNQRYYGFDTDSLTPIAPTTVADLMSYNSTFWMSDYTWRGLFDAISSTAVVEAVRQSNTTAQAQIAAAEDVVYISGSVDTKANTGGLDYAWVYPIASLSAGMRAKLLHNAAPQASRNAPQDTGGYTLRLLDAAGNLLDERTITPQAAEDGDDTVQTFALTFPAPATQVARLELTSGGAVIATLQPGSGLPTISILNPAGGETIDNQMTLSWRASDPDANDKLLYTVQYSPDNGAHWQTMLTSFPNPSGSDTTTLNVSQLSGLPGSISGGIIRVAASDGYNTAIALSNPFTVTPRAPVPYIDSPSSTPIPAGQPVIVRGGATDVVDGGLSDAALTWTLNGQSIGNGTQQVLNGLAPGSYTLELTATNAAGKTATATTTFTVASLVVPQVATAPAMDGLCTDPAFANAASVSLAPYDDGSQASVRLVRSSDALWACFMGMPRTGGSSPGTLAGIRIDTDNSRDAQPQAGDVAYSLGEDGTIKSAVGNGSTYTIPGPAGASGQVSANGTFWTAELRIDVGVFGGWDRVVGLVVEQDHVNALDDNHFWPYAAQSNSPSSWAPSALGDVPQATSLAPGSAPVRSGDTTVTINGSGFASGATALWNGTPRATTVVSSTQLQAIIPSADLTPATAAQVAVANPGLQVAPSNALPFTVTNPTPQISALALNDKTLTVNGNDFVNGAIVIWNGEERPTTYVNGGQLQATLNDADTLNAAATGVTVFNPGPGGGVSNITTLSGGNQPPGGSSTKIVYMPLIVR